MLPEHYPLFNLFSGKRVHLGLTASIAAYKAVELLRLLQKSSVDCGATLTRSARDFVGPLTLSGLGADPVYWGRGSDLQDPYAHLAPARSAHTLVIVPASANIIAKAAHGLADDMLSTQIVASGAPVFFCPSMNPAMWENQATRDNVKLLQSRGHVIVEPHEGVVACKDMGTGRLAPVPEIYYHILRSLSPKDLSGKKVLVTAGPTHEYFDLVRYFGNPSSGRMGLAIALACWLRGAGVCFVHGPMASVFSLPGFEPMPVTSAREMLSACQAVWDDCDAGFFSAAVSDFAPASCSRSKFKKDDLRSMSVEMNANPDVLATLSSRKTSSQIVAGFAAEAVEMETNARLKLERKNLDMIIANQVRPGHTPFGSMDNQVMVMDKNGRTETWPCLSKAEIAWRLIDWISLI
ncbi:MAG: bifunctional phosphopantothenoylcysteine decarboxylase/phosphopantothenate--cysteine ligase CoaBC [Desulfonatronovibrio sp.]